MFKKKSLCSKTLRILWLKCHIFGFPHDAQHFQLCSTLLVIVQVLNAGTRDFCFCKRNFLLRQSVIFYRHHWTSFTKVYKKMNTFSDHSSRVGLIRLLNNQTVLLKIGYRHLAAGNSFTSLHFEYILGETIVREIIRDWGNGIWNCLKPTEISEKTENDWVNIANDFYGRMQFPNFIGALDGKHIRIKVPSGSGSLF